MASWTARGFAESTIGNDVGVLERMLAALGRPVWEVTADDVDRVVGALASLGRAVSTRRNYLQVFKGFHRFLEVRKAAEIEAAFGVRLACPLDEFNTARHVGDDSPSADAPPTPERVAAFFEYLKGRIATARKYGPAARDYALFRILYHAGLRAEEVVMLDRSDVHFGRGPFGKLHVRFGKGAKGSGPRPRWVPMLDGLDLVLRWYLDDVRGRFPDGPVLLCDESGGRMAAATIRNRLRHLMSVEGRPEAEWFSPHGMRRACATRNYEWGVDLVAIQQLLGSLDGRVDHAIRAPVGNVRRRRLPARDLGDAERADRTRARIDADHLEIADGRRATRGLDRRATATAARREGRVGAVLGVGVGVVHQTAQPDQADHPDRVVHRPGLHPERPARHRHHPCRTTDLAEADRCCGERRAAARRGRSMPPI